MGQLVTTVHAWDVMDLVHVAATVRTYHEGQTERPDIEYVCTTTFPGTGESDPRQWLEDVLVGLLESL